MRWLGKQWRNAMNWIPTTEKPHPDKPGLARYEHIPCLVVYHGEICIRQWNCEHLVWDDEDGDDFCCKADEVMYWMPLPPMPNAPAHAGLLAVKRLEWLHDCSTGTTDPEGYEWGIYRVKWVNGRAVDVQQTLSDFSDLDAEMERECKANKELSPSSTVSPKDTDALLATIRKHVEKIPCHDCRSVPCWYCELKRLIANGH
jgi:hypothetical protein